ncbi:MAG TPA: sigma-70 family RNA polymerase sigma factor [Candidatus Paceibacterota bacterium]|nr:sigma-70 family RNA polymerase sigma factor [Candidatus Paceibacterota bacterium]
MVKKSRAEMDAELVERARRGDWEAFEQISSTCRKLVYGVCVRMLRNHSDAEDVTQEAFLRAYQKIGQFRGESKLSTWITRIAATSCLMRLRRRDHRDHFSIDELIETKDGGFQREIASVDRALASVIDNVSFEKALKAISANDRLVLYMFHVQGYNHNEIAALLEISIPAVKSRLLRGRLAARAAMACSQFNGRPSPVDP